MSWSDSSFLSNWNQRRPAIAPRAIVWTQFSLDSILGRASWKFRSDKTLSCVQKLVGHCQLRSSSELLVDEEPWLWLSIHNFPSSPLTEMKMSGKSKNLNLLLLHLRLSTHLLLRKRLFVAMDRPQRTFRQIYCLCNVQGREPSEMSASATRHRDGSDRRLLLRVLKRKVS